MPLWKNSGAHGNADSIWKEHFSIGATLLETLLVIAVMGALSAVVFSNLGILRVLATSRNGERSARLNELLGAISFYTIDHDGTMPPNIVFPGTNGPVGFSQFYVIGTNVESGRNVALGDLDGDGDKDIVAAGGDDEEVNWWQKSGVAPNFTWTKRTVDDDFEEAWDISTGDIDGDGRIDVAAVSRDEKEVVWWRNLGGSPPIFSAQIIVDGDHNGVRVIELADIDGDTDLDILVGSDSNMKRVRWYRNNGSPLTGNWSYKDVSTNFGNVRFVLAYDVDKDGDLDVLAANHNDKDVSWFLNNGSPWNNNWTQYDIDSNFNQAHDIIVADIDGDADNDVIGISTVDGVAWWENSGNPEQNNWTKHTVATNFTGDSIIIFDIDNDGDGDIVGGSSGGDKIAYWTHQGGGVFDSTFIAASGNDADGVSDLEIDDVDLDGAKDLVAVNSQAQTVVWWQNSATPSESVSASIAAMATAYKPVCMFGTSVAACDGNGGVSLDVLVPGYLTELHRDPSEDTGSMLTGYEVKFDGPNSSIAARASLAELGKVIEIRSPVGVANCLVWDIMNSDERACVLFE